MEVRIVALESFAVETRDRLARIETKLDTFATKADLQALRADLHKDLHQLTWRLLGGASAMIGLVYWISKNVH